MFFQTMRVHFYIDICLFKPVIDINLFYYKVVEKCVKITIFIWFMAVSPFNRSLYLRNHI